MGGRKKREREREKPHRKKRSDLWAPEADSGVGEVGGRQSKDQNFQF